MKQPTRVVESHEVSRNGSRVCGAVVSGCSACTLECGVVPGMRSCARLDVVPTVYSILCLLHHNFFIQPGGRRWRRTPEGRRYRRGLSLIRPASRPT